MMEKLDRQWVVKVGADAAGWVMPFLNCEEDRDMEMEIEIGETGIRLGEPRWYASTRKLCMGGLVYVEWQRDSDNGC